MVKLKSIEISGFRGVRDKLNIPFPSSSSLLLFGENGGGKSSVTDGLEWFIFDRVNHLSVQEIGRNGIPALRNMKLPQDEDAFVALEFSDPALSAKKTLSINKSRYTSACSNVSQEFEDYRKASAEENIILRYRDLLDFILSTKSEKLEALSQIIGFGEVTKTKKILRKAANDLVRLEKLRDYDGRISSEQAEIIECLGQNVISEAQFIDATNDLLSSLDLDLEVTDRESLNKAIAKLKSPADEEVISLGISFRNVHSSLLKVQEASKICRTRYNEYHEKHKRLSEDSEKLNALGLERLLIQGVSVLEGAWEHDTCPMCLQAKNRNELIEDLKNRQKLLAELRREYNELNESKEGILAILQELVGTLVPAVQERCLSQNGSNQLKSDLETILKSLMETQTELSNSSVFGEADIAAPEDFLSLDDIDLSAEISVVEEKIKAIGEHRRGDQRFSVAEKLSMAERAFGKVVVLRDEQEKLRLQADSMESICREFVRREKEALTHFLAGISDEINDMYLFMNPDERVEGIRLVLLGQQDELVGVSLEMAFDGENVSPPEIYLSESHVNCLGICLFLSSVITFNKVNRFLVLDDVISSFDTNHRIRFGHLLLERFKDYQIMLFTHEQTWFDYMTNLVKGVGWKIRRVVWDDDMGVLLNPAPEGQRFVIQSKLRSSDIEGLGNIIRTYLERILKESCANLEVRLKFVFNDSNEDRMIGEMLPALMGTLKRHKCNLKSAPVVGRMLPSTSLANKVSHDSSLVASTGDLKALWADVDEFEQHLVCEQCTKMISKRYLDLGSETIGCKCGSLRYNWNVNA